MPIEQSYKQRRSAEVVVHTCVVHAPENIVGCRREQVEPPSIVRTNVHVQVVVFRIAVFEWADHSEVHCLLCARRPTALLHILSIVHFILNPERLLRLTLLPTLLRNQAIRLRPPLGRLGMRPEITFEAL
jgi:hypothetical protein